MPLRQSMERKGKILYHNTKKRFVDIRETWDQATKMGYFAFASNIVYTFLGIF